MLLTAGTVLIVLVAALWGPWGESDAFDGVVPGAKRDQAPPTTGSPVLSPPSSNAANPGATRAPIRDAASQAARTAAFPAVKRATPGFRVRVSGLPGLASGRCELRAHYYWSAPAGQLAYIVSSQVVQPSGWVEFPVQLVPEQQALEWVEFRFSLTGEESFRRGLVTRSVLFVDQGTAASAFRLPDCDGLQLQPQEPLAGICLVNERGEELWSHPLEFRFPSGRGRLEQVGWLPFRHAYLESLDQLILIVGNRERRFPADLYPLGADGLMRVPLAELGNWGRELLVRSGDRLPPTVELRIEREWNGEFHSYDKGAAGPTALAIKRSVEGWTCEGMPPGRYRVSAQLTGLQRGGVIEIGVVDLWVANRAVLQVPDVLLQRNLVVHLRLPEDLSQRGLRPWRVCFEPGSEAAQWTRVDQGRTKFDWLGPLPRTAHVSGGAGPRFPAELSVNWSTERVGEVDLRHGVLRRCLILEPESEVRLIVPHLRQTKVDGANPAWRRTWALLSATEAHWELAWWEGADFELPLHEDLRAVRSPDHTPSLFEPLSPWRIGDATRYTPRRLAGNPSRLVLDTKLGGAPWVLAYLRPGAPREETLALPLDQLEFHGFVRLDVDYEPSASEVFVPPQATGLLLQEPRAGQRAYLRRGDWSERLELETLRWR